MLHDMSGELRLNVLELLYLLLCQASVADAAVPGRPDDGAACEEERRMRRRRRRRRRRE